MSERVSLPNRRPALTLEIAHRGQVFALTVGFDAAGGAREVFASGAKEGSDMQALICDACVVISLALQHGAAPAGLARSLGRVPDLIRGQAGGDLPASVIGRILEALEASA